MIENNRTPQWLNPIKIAWIAVGLFLLANIALSLIRLLNKPFNPDELQHLHIAWMIANGDILYRDFWEHHGPLYSLLNGALIYLTDPEPSVRILYLSRFFSAAVIGGVMAITWRLARQLSLSPFGAFLAIAVCSSIYFVQNKGVEMRPDSLQALFWTGGLYLLVCNQSKGNLRRAIFAGTLFGLAILSNAKAGIGPVFVGIYYLTGRWLCRLDWADIWRDIGGMVIGACIAASPFLLYFWANAAAGDFLYYNFVWNFLLNYYWSTVYQGSLTGEEAGVAVRNLEFLVQYQLPLLILTAVGAIAWLGKLRFSHNEIDAASTKMAWLFIIATAGTSLGWMLNQHSQYFLMFLPFWSILASYALIKMTSLLPERHRTVSIAAASLIAIIAATNMLWYSLSKTSLSEHPLLKTQKYFTATFVALTKRDEPVALTWSLCGGYMFNPHVGHYWVAMPYISDVIEAISGEHPFSQPFIDEMETRQVRYVIGNQNWMTEGLTDDALAYLNNNFEYSNCLWTRKE
jgi:hypothetical protein